MKARQGAGNQQAPGQNILGEFDTSYSKRKLQAEEHAVQVDIETDVLAIFTITKEARKSESGARTS